MADMRISEMTTAAGLHDGDLFETSQTDSISSSGYASYKTSLSAIAAFIAKQVQYSGDLQTTSKTLIGAINEVFNAGTSVTVTNVLPATETTKRVATITVDDVEKDINADDTVKVITDLKTPKSATITNGIAQFECIEENLVKGLKVTMSPIQSGSGNPSPTNIRPISGRTEASVTRTGANQWDEQTRNGYYTPTGTFQSYSGNIATKNKIKVLPNTSYYFKCGSGNYFGRLCWYDANGNFVSTEVVQTGNMTKTAPSNAYYLNFDMVGAYGTTYNDDISINYPSTDTNYHAYTAETHTHQYSETIYGGVDDFGNGGAASNMGVADLGSLNWTFDSANNRFQSVDLTATAKGNATTVLPNMLCECYPVFKASDTATTTLGITLFTSGQYVYLRVIDANYSTLADFVTAVTGKKVCYELATPTTISTSADEITTVSGTNIISGTEPISECKYTELATVDDLIKIIGGQ